MRPELRKTNYLRKLKAEILKEAVGIDLPEDFEDIKTALEDIYGDDGAKAGLIAEVAGIKDVMIEEPENGGVVANILDWRINGVRKDDLDLRTRGDVFLINDQTDAGDGVYQVPDGTSIVGIDRETLSGEVKLASPGDAPSVILIIQTGGDPDVVRWDDTQLSVSPINLLIRAGDNYAEIPLIDVVAERLNALEDKLTNTMWALDASQYTQPTTVYPPDGTGLINVSGAAEEITVRFDNKSMYPQIVAIQNADDSSANVVVDADENITVAPDGRATVIRVGDDWVDFAIITGSE